MSGDGVLVVPIIDNKALVPCVAFLGQRTHFDEKSFDFHPFHQRVQRTLFPFAELEVLAK